MITLNFYFSEDETEVSTIQMHPDAAAARLALTTTRWHATRRTATQWRKSASNTLAGIR
jgi:hypothetical protein